MIKVKVNSQPIVSVGVASDASMKVNVGSTTMIAPSELEQYAGPYEVVPKVNSQTLSTARKMMRDDITVREVPYYEVSNQFGGNTVYIAKEL